MFEVLKRLLFIALTAAPSASERALSVYRWFFEDAADDVELLLQIARGVNAALEESWRDLREQLSAVPDELPG